VAPTTTVAPTTVPPTTTTVVTPAVALGKFVVMKTGSKVLTLSGGSTLSVNGDVLVNSSAADWVSGLSGLSYTGTLRTGGTIDPLAALPYPSQTGLPVYTDGRYRGPGVYRTQPLTIDSPTTMAPGIYIVEAGFSVPGGNRVTGTGIVIFNGCGRNAPLTCTPTGKFTISGGSTAGLSAPTSGPYAGMVMFQERTNTSDVTVSGGSLVSSFNGVIYAVNAGKVTLGSGGSQMSMSGVVASTVVVSGGSQITIQ
jgi:hypothetical protein